MNATRRLLPVLIAVASALRGDESAAVSSCRLDRLKIYPVSKKSSILSLKIRIVNDDDCWYRVSFSGRAHNPPDALHQECPNCCTTSPVGKMCDCTFSDIVDVSPHHTIQVQPGCRNRVCGGCGENASATHCDDGYCTLAPQKTCGNDSACGQGEGTCHHPCLEVYLTEAVIQCASFNGNSYGLVPGGMSVSTVCSPRRPCSEFMPAQGSPLNDTCTELTPAPGCMVDDTNGPVIVIPQFGHSACVPVE